MTLRVRLLLMIGVSMLLLWGGVAIWMLHGLEQEMQRTLDQRLEMSAHMVAGLMSQNPAAWDGSSGKAGVSTLSMPETVKGLACQVSLRGEVIARTPGAAPQAIDLATPGFSDRNIKGEDWRSYTLDKLGLRVTTSDRLSERSTLLRNVMVAAVVPFVVALLGSLLVLWFGVGSGLRPLERLRQVLASRTPDSLTPIENAPISRDLRPLVNTLNHLLARVSETFSRERRFTSDAAHELRTPLTAIKIHLQVARITHAQEAVVAMDYAEEGVARLQHSLSQLLTLSQVEGDFSWDDGRVAEANEVARLAIRDAAPDATERIVLDSDGNRAELSLPQALAVTALRNLLDNALRHSPAENSIRLEIRRSPETIRFHVLDRGPGLSDKELVLATQRFWRRGSGRGSGLGLSIVAAIAERFGGSFELLQRPEGGLEAKLTLTRKKQLDSS
ncbi:MAG: sensor histidine kinase N-terminal domain-containing protein [Gammaproteobacteria bacterium]|uniref:ATP-binding protein n=1 Tax=Rhodoferax sp. TaxID=50421 RepID=UPI001DBEC87E|nr:ATP-binding protein [Rhodoferax sp.]MBU3899714.1 sensor histidine kinase N-terminal domain-containing protein [Gammaproteobacteria bacterium]MBU3996281.1 sensor histidine kinase N-terminal domain-containing protein [Gammaproteobacteria bacterium]MBU4018190.1 sensor histidine kinase N-terminal domain-containing protein [Gammaproteobacteria bacterium]MBU4080119.1 sensor histidine kinase N-terminal domain-containing protein [Gammaproteobacteria bacterium]MBU4112393.1 sensor histidine kinase N-